ncbi:hypothetical protein RN004_003848 [Salmonella enterica]|nr:hypothetical protein [Salmonella enterica]
MLTVKNNICLSDVTTLLADRANEKGKVSKGDLRSAIKTIKHIPRNSISLSDFSKAFHDIESLSAVLKNQKSKMAARKGAMLADILHFGEMNRSKDAAVPVKSHAHPAPLRAQAGKDTVTPRFSGKRDTGVNLNGEVSMTDKPDEQIKFRHLALESYVIKLENDKYNDMFGLKVGSGATCNVYLNKNNSSLVLKSFNDGEFEDKIHAAKNELSAFIKYYGDDSASIFTNGSDVSLQLVKIPGKSLSDINDKKLPDNAMNLFFNMILRMNDAGLYHDDLSINNIFYDKSTNQFYPIDFSTTLDSFFELSDGGKRYFNTLENKKLNTVINYIKANIPVINEDA